MSVRPHDGGKPPRPPALDEWPAPPGDFSEAERECWARIGSAAGALRTISTADMGVVTRSAQISARVESALRDRDYTPTALNALLRLELDYWKQLGLSPQSRRSVTPLPQGQESSGFEDIEDGAVVAGRISHG